MNNILKTIESCFRISWENLGKFWKIFQKVPRNTAEILEKYFKNFENYCGEFGEFFQKIIFKIEGFIVKTVIVHFFEIEIKYDSKGKFPTENDGNIGF